MITDNEKEFKNDLFKKIPDELGTKHHYLRPYHPQSNGVLETFQSFLNICIEKLIQAKLY